MDPEIQELNAHSELCVNQAYCLNGGTCYLLSALGRLYCQCAESFEGERCHLKTVGIPGWDMARTYENIFSDWNRWLPVAIVVAVAILFMVILFCSYVCGKKCYQKYYIPSPKKIPIYQNASAQTSISQLYLLTDETQCNGQLARAMTISSRTRLIACSTTPDNPDTSHHSLTESRRSCLDLESGSCSEADLLKPDHTSTPPWIVQTKSDTIEVCRGFRRDQTDQIVTCATAPAAATAQSMPTKSQQTTNWQGTSASCLSPNDSNNNKQNVFACNASRQVTDCARVHERTTLLSHPGSCTHNNCVRDSVSANNKDANSLPSDLYDSDPEATAL